MKRDSSVRGGLPAGIQGPVAVFLPKVTQRAAFVWAFGALVVGLATAFSPHVWLRGWPRLDGETAVFELWAVFPFGLLAALIGARIISRPGVLLGLVLAVFATVSAHTGVDDDAQGALLLIFVPGWLLIAVLILWGGDALVRVAASRVRRTE